MHQVLSDCMSPVLRTAESPIGIVLIEDVRLALPEDRAIRIVHPVRRGQEMILGTVTVSGQPARPIVTAGGNRGQCRECAQEISPVQSDRILHWFRK